VHWAEEENGEKQGAAAKAKAKATPFFFFNSRTQHLLQTNMNSCCKSIASALSL
jgi:hypothetical protein